MDYELNHKNKCKEIPLHELMKRSFHITDKNEDVTYRLKNAVQSDNIEETCRLLYYGADVNKADKHNQTVFNSALTNNNLNMALILINYCNDISVTEAYSMYTSLLCKNSRLSSRLLVNTKAEEILVKYFKQFSFKIYLELISNTEVRFLEDYLQKCDFSGSNFLECLNTVLDCSDSKLLLQNFNEKYDTGNFHNLLNAFSEKHIQRRDRTATIWTWMSLGAQVNIMNINIAVYFFGFSEEVESLIYTAGVIKVCCLRILPLTVFIMGLEEDFSTVEIFEKFLLYWYNQGIPDVISFGRCDVAFNAVQIVLDSLCYFTIPDRIKKVFLIEFKGTTLYCLEIVQMIKKLPKIPTLIELSRDQARKHIRQVNEIKKPYQFHDAVKKLNVPLTVKDIIRFKKPMHCL